MKVEPRRSNCPLFATFAALIAATAIGFASGCDNKETLLDVETSEGGMEIERNRDTGEITVEVDE